MSPQATPALARPSPIDPAVQGGVERPGEGIRDKPDQCLLAIAIDDSGTELPKYSSGVESSWQGLFPQTHRWIDPASGQQGRHYLDPSLIQKAGRRAVLAAGVSKPATLHTFHHSFATHLQERWQDIRTIQE